MSAEGDDAIAVDFASFFQEQHVTLLRALYLITGDRYEAEEVVQDAFVRICERWDRVQRMSNPAGYLYRTAVNTYRSTVRRASYAAKRALSIQAVDPISQSDERDTIRRALATLPSGQREALVLVEWIGMSDVETGEVLGISAGAVRVRVSRANAALRLLIERSSA